MKKVGIITLYYNNNNYGGVAQGYALRKYFEKIGYESEMITYKSTSKNLGLVNKEKSIKIISKKVRNKIKRYVNQIREKKYINMYKNELEERKRKLEKFRNDMPHSKVYDSSSINEIENNYDYFVTGSDQCWNPGVIDNGYVFSFLKGKNKKIFSYASSVAVSKVSDKYKNFMKKELEKYNTISIRELDSQEILENITNRKIDWVIDPTLLLDYDDWNRITSERILKEKYAFAYILGDDQKERNIVKEIAKKKNLKLVTLPYIKDGNKFEFKIQDLNFGDEQMINISFEDFLSLIKYSELVITDSFHAICFSYIFKREFYAIEKKSVISTSSRIKSMLSLMKCENRLIDDGNQIDERKINYDIVTENVSKLINKSKKFIDNSLERN